MKFRNMIKNITIIALSVALMFCGYYYHKTEQELNYLNSVLNKNPLLKSCFTHYRKNAFMQKGGEYLPNYEHPRTLNDKVAYYLENYFFKSPITKVIGTKYFAKKYVADIVGNEHVVQLLGVWDNPEDINWDLLPNKFVLKTVRGNFGREVILVSDKSKLNVSGMVKQLRFLCENTPGIKEFKIDNKRIIAEELLEPEGNDLIDYKFFCSFGKPLVAYCLAMKKNSETDVDSKTFSFYSVPEWKRLYIKADTHGFNNIPKPKNYIKMIELCEKLSKPFPLIRIDLYEIGDRVLVGEITEDASGGKSIMNPVIWDFKLGENIPVLSTEEIQTLIERDKIVANKYLTEE